MYQRAWDGYGFAHGVIHDQGFGSLAVHTVRAHRSVTCPQPGIIDSYACPSVFILKRFRGVGTFAPSSLFRDTCPATVRVCCEAGERKP